MALKWEKDEEEERGVLYDIKKAPGWRYGKINGLEKEEEGKLIRKKRVQMPHP